jgi:hypothetical protein
LNSKSVWRYIRSRNSLIFALENGCTQFRLQQTWLDTRFMDSCESSLFAFRDSSGVPTSILVEPRCLQRPEGIP